MDQSKNQPNNQPIPGDFAEFPAGYDFSSDCNEFAAITSAIQKLNLLLSPHRIQLREVNKASFWFPEDWDTDERRGVSLQVSLFVPLPPGFVRVEAFSESRDKNDS